MTRRSLVRLDPGISEERPCHARIVRRLHVASHRMVCARDGSGCVGRRQGRLYMYEAHAPPTAEGAAGASFLQYGVWYECREGVEGGYGGKEGLRGLRDGGGSRGGGGDNDGRSGDAQEAADVEEL